MDPWFASDRLGVTTAFERVGLTPVLELLTTVDEPRATIAFWSHRLPLTSTMRRMDVRSCGQRIGEGPVRPPVGSIVVSW